MEVKKNSMKNVLASSTTKYEEELELSSGLEKSLTIDIRKPLSAGMEVEDKFIRAAVSKYEEDLSLKLEAISFKNLLAPHLDFEKSPALAESLRKTGNVLFQDKPHNAETHLKTYHDYTKCISRALIPSEEQALGYGNRSALLKHLGKFEDCIRDIDRALKITEYEILKVKLLCRKVECLKELGLAEYKQVLESTKLKAEKVSERDKESLLKLISKAEACEVKPKKVISGYENNKPKVAKVIANKAISKVLDSLRISRNDKFGRHIIANKDFEPGDIILVEDAYASDVRFDKTIFICSYCTKTCLSNIPCDSCNWAMFCDEECKRKAWNDYHDMECNVVPGVLNHFRDTFMMSHQLCLRALIKGVKETGSIAALKKELKFIDECTDPVNKGFFKDGKFNSDSIRAVYSLKSDGISDDRIEPFAYKTLIVMLCLMKNSTFFGETFCNPKVRDIINNEDVHFAACLFLRLCLIRENNFFVYPQYNGELKTDRISKTNYGSAQIIAPFTSLFNHSCFPNANVCFPNGRKIMVYAAAPIKKKSQIFISYGCLFNMSSKAVRKTFLQTQCQMTCDCQACENNWPTICDYTKAMGRKEWTDIELAIQKIAYPIMLAAGEPDNPLVLDQKSIRTLSKCIVLAYKSFKPPAQVIHLLNDSLHKVFWKVYESEVFEFSNNCQR